MGDIDGDAETDLGALMGWRAAVVEATSDNPPESILRPVASEATIAALISTTSPRAPDALEHLAANQDQRAGESATDWQST